METKKKNLFEKKKGFTLAEVLITLGIIGVVAAITIPALITNIGDRQRTERKKNIMYKLSQATDKMQAESHILGWASTDAYVDELSKHMKLLQVCKGNEVSKCWPYDKIVLSDGKEVEVNGITDAGWFQLDKDSWSNPVGLITGDGVPMIISYNKNCTYDEGTAPTTDRGTGKSTSLGCIAGIFDWNGASAPNGYGTDKSDVFAINTINGLGNKVACSVDKSLTGGTCFVGQAFAANVPLDCTDEANSKYCGGVQQDKYSSWDPTYKVYDATQDSWAGANKQCLDNNSHLATQDELTKLARYLYNDESIRNDWADVTGKPERFSEFGLPVPNVDINDYAIHSADGGRYINIDHTTCNFSIARNGDLHGGGTYYGICVAD